MAAFHDTDTTRAIPCDDVGVGVVECGLYCTPVSSGHSSISPSYNLLSVPAKSISDTNEPYKKLRYIRD